MDDDAVEAVREKLAKGIPDVSGDGRPIARPASTDLWLHARGVRIAAMRPMEDGSAHIWFDLGDSSGWWQPDDGERRELPDGLPCLRFCLDYPPDSSGYFAGTIWGMWTWMNERVPVDVYAARGAWTLLLSPGIPYRKGTVRSALIATLLPPEAADQPVSSGNAAPAEFPASADSAEFEAWLEANECAGVTLQLPDAEAATAYARTWFIPRKRADDFAGMMTHRFGPAVEMMIDADKAMEHHEGDIIMTGDGGALFGDGDS